MRYACTSRLYILYALYAPMLVMLLPPFFARVVPFDFILSLQFLFHFPLFSPHATPSGFYG